MPPVLELAAGPDRSGGTVHRQIEAVAGALARLAQYVEQFDGLLPG